MTDNQLDHLITVADPRSPVSEAYRTLRTNLDFSSLDKPIKTMLVTSTGPDEGKSTVLANLAVATAQTGRKVILVDCDLRRPALHNVFNLKKDVGLTTMVVDDAAMESPPLQDTGVEGLQIVSSGPLPPNPSELLGSRRMEEIIAALLERADVVLFDAPPVVAVTDAAVLATKVDGVLLVINAGGTKRDYARVAKARLEKVNANLLGAVLNNVRFDVSLHRYYAAQM
ncbi:MAG: polysaccharide biosynthesis tyrosine autokinase [Anaerolineales bacterium]|nr:MAG: polysaccharide biosynthesis tyrosine autokinase [Anaerolineales bacterium]